MVGYRLPFTLPELAQVELVKAIYDCDMPEVAYLDLEPLFKIAKESNLRVYVTLSAHDCRHVICNYSVIGVLHHTVEVKHGSPLGLILTEVTDREEVKILDYDKKSILFNLRGVNKNNLTKEAVNYEVLV